METLHYINPTRNISEIVKRERLTLALAGIVIAIICSLVFLNDTTERTATKSIHHEHSKIVPAGLALDIKKSNVASALLLSR